MPDKKPDLTLIELTDEELDRLAIITDTDLSIAHLDIQKHLSPKYKNILMATESDLENAFTGQSES